MANIGDIIIADDHVEVTGGLQVTGESSVQGPNGSLNVEQVLWAQVGNFRRNISVGTGFSIGGEGFILYSPQNIPTGSYDMGTLQQVMTQRGIEAQKIQAFINAVFNPSVPIWTASDINQTYLLINAEKISIVAYHLTGMPQIIPGQIGPPYAISIIPGSPTSSVDVITFDAKNGTVKIAGLSQ
jgi:hypothetical protein